MRKTSRLSAGYRAIANAVLVMVGGVVIAGCGGGTAAANSPAPTVNFLMAAQNGSHVAGTGQIVTGTVHSRSRSS